MWQNRTVLACVMYNQATPGLPDCTSYSLGGILIAQRIPEDNVIWVVVSGRGRVT